ncbi:MAG: TraB/GumN family protein [Maricaulaceae bacterium]
MFQRALAGWVVSLLVALCGRAEAEPALWRVSDADTDITLFGTVHVLPKTVDWRSPALDAAFDAADTLYLEAPLDPQAQEEAGRALLDYGYNRRGRFLTGQLSRPGRRALERLVDRLGLPLQALQPLRPWHAGIVIGLTVARRQGAVPSFGADAALHEAALEAGKSIAFLETPMGQLALLAGFPQPVEQKLFEASIMSYVETPQSFSELTEAWVAGDQATLSRIVETNFAPTPQVRRALLTERNRDWLKVLEAQFNAPRSVFFAVGAAHFVGADGLLALLCAQGRAPVRIDHGQAEPVCAGSEARP